ncbi:unnamed protein product [Pylaiella littoralis]
MLLRVYTGARLSYHIPPAFLCGCFLVPLLLPLLCVTCMPPSSIFCVRPRPEQDPDRVRDDVLELSKLCKTLVPKRGSVALSSGRVELLTLHGTFPMSFRGVQYHTPVQIYIKESYPTTAPLCYIVPTPGLSLRVGHHHVDQSGLVSLPYLESWSAASHNLAQLIDTMSVAFGAEPPLCATPAPSNSVQPLSEKGQAASNEEPSSSPESGTVQVVCPSYGRTGTMSMKAALQILGFGPCYHMVSLFEKKGHGKLWLDGFQGRGLPANKIFNGYKAVVDWPAADFYKEILAANPNAKVVVTLRNPDAWWDSMVRTISHKNPAHSGLGIFFWAVISPWFCDLKFMLQHIKTLGMEEEDAKVDYLRHNKEVLAHVQADQLLEFSVREGWEPLCEFLGVPVPDEPFPRINSTEEMTNRIKRANTSGWLVMAATVTVAGASVAAAAIFGGKRAGGAVAATEVVFFTSRVRKALLSVSLSLSLSRPECVVRL